MKYLKPYNESNELHDTWDKKLSEYSSKLREAFNIYEEELPFDVNDATLELTPIWLFINDSDSDNNLELLIKYKHVDNELKEQLSIIEGDTNAKISRLQLDEFTKWATDTKKLLHNKVKVDVDLYFRRFAKKYNLKYVYTTVLVLFDDDYIFGRFLNNNLNNTSDIKYDINVNIKFTTIIE